MVTVVTLLFTDPEYDAPFNVMVTTCPFSTPTVLTVTVPSASSSIEFNTAPQLKALVPIALILGAVVSTRKDALVTGVAGFPLTSDTFATTE